ncbi:HAD-IIIC family phosphatase, partial [Frankia sp. AgKG'84/4]
MPESGLHRNPDSLKIIISSSFTAGPVGHSIKFWADLLGLSINITFGPYGQVFQQLHEYGGEGRYLANAFVIAVRMEDFIPSGGHEEALSVAGDLATTLTAAALRSPETLFVLAVCPPSAALHQDPYRLGAVGQATQALRLAACAGANITTLEPVEIVQRYQVQRVEDGIANGLASIPYTPEYFAALGTALVRRIHRVLAAEPKVLVVDADNTLWDGVLGEVGCAGIEVGPARQEIQEFLLDQRRAGRLLCLCSKNSASDIQEVFAAVPEMRLGSDDFVDLRANWLAKSVNIQSMADDLDLPLDSFIFIDDSAVECAEVRSRCPTVVTLQVSPDASLAIESLRHFWPLDTAEVGGEVLQRTALYRQEQQRRELRRTSPQSLSEFIDSLDLVVTIRAAGPADGPRMVELMRRTTQFNLTAERYSRAETEALPPSTRLHVVDVEDRFGSYGSVGLIVFGFSEVSLTVQNFLLSCRALGRGVEHRMLNHLGEIALAEGLDSILLPYVATLRNQPAWQFLEEVAEPRGPRTEERVEYVVGARKAANHCFDPERR